MDITRQGHSCVLVETAGTRVLIDPGAFSPDDPFTLTDLDAIVITHQHPDHVDRARLAGLVARNPGARLLADPETAAELGGDWTVTADGAAVEVGGMTLTGVGSEHAVIVPDLACISNVGVLVAADGAPTLYHPGDSYASAPEGVDVLALPLSAPWAKIAETVDFVRRVAPRALFPIHDRTIAEIAYGIYWGHVGTFGGVDDVRQLGQTDTTTVG